MLTVLLLLTILFNGAMAGITDLNCTSLQGGAMKYSPEAVNCKNRISDAACINLYTAAVAVATDTDRNAKCGPDADLKEVAIEFCPLTCGYCCQTAAYLCQDKQIPRIQCSTVTQAMCQSTVWRPILAEDCPKTCGLCAEGSCTDTTPYCNSDPMICRIPEMQAFVQENCKKTCGLCGDSIASSPAPNGVACGNDANCANWIRQGFCNSTFYPYATRYQHCGRPCGFC
ncbi:hypothetical protein Q1695_006949 [Nippostrongylus brasiliensis]|nr:hypothetical protein Q1695_006949 [Nippostrongylus brasiliensis]